MSTKVLWAKSNSKRSQFRANLTLFKSKKINMIVEIRMQILSHVGNVAENFCQIELASIREFVRLKGCKYINHRNKSNRKSLHFRQSTFSGRKSNLNGKYSMKNFKML